MQFTGWFVFFGFIFLISCFFSIFLDLYSIMAVYNYVNFNLTFTLSLGITTLLVMFMLLVSCWGNCFTRTLYFIASVIVGSLVYLTFACIIFNIANAIKPLPFWLGKVLIFGLSLPIILYGLINASFLKLEEITLKIPQIKRPLSIMHLSDLHLGPIYGSRYVTKISSIINSLQPDLVVITGDLFDGTLKITHDMIAPFRDIPKKIFYVLGNHEEYGNLDDVNEAIKDTNITLIRNSIVEFQGCNFIGIDYLSTTGPLKAQLTALKIPLDAANILLYHAPVMTADDLEKQGICLHLCGHTHGGQMIPGHLVTWVLCKYFGGLYKSTSENCYVHVSTGTGTAGPPMRVFSTTRMTLIKINPEKEEIV